MGVRLSGLAAKRVRAIGRAAALVAPIVLLGGCALSSSAPATTTSAQAPVVLPSSYLSKESAYSARHFGFRARVVYQEFVPNTVIFTIRGTGFYDGSNGSMLEHLDTDDVADGINSRLTIDAVRGRKHPRPTHPRLARMSRVGT